ncbi:hypothetical protein GGR50DRAFT_689937 [Xylaria sp. CBS 124048]|nr:hypothetical protein GGR50DRAFT_689937 [Xylaria sp. CBS 124048]
MPITEIMALFPDPARAHATPAHDLYDPDDLLSHGSPPLTAYIPKVTPSPSPPAIPHIVSRSPRLAGKSSNRRRKVDPTRGDAVLIQHLDGGRRPEISREAGYRPLDLLFNPGDDAQYCSDSEMMCDGSEDEDETYLRLAENAVAAAKAVSDTADTRILQSPNIETQVSRRVGPIRNSTNGGGGGGEPIIIPNAKHAVLAPPLSPYSAIHSTPETHSPRRHTSSQVLLASNSLQSPTSQTCGNHGELAPFQMASPRSDLSSHDPLPSISQLYEQLNASPKAFAVRPSPQFPHTPRNHTSPPISPNKRYRSDLLSPEKSLSAMSPFQSIGTYNSHQSPLALDYSGSGDKFEQASINQTLTPPQEGNENKMSIDNVTGPSVTGLFKCTYRGCKAQPFQTQYLLNSHANVHSTNRPHYCPVEGCPRGEKGQGFKRKNEMIRHGLVHDSPGYVCPFCPDREHKYPRPDNLQRHVRFHHIDRDKEDPALREVLAHRPDGPNRGRRRRVAAS